MLPGFLKQFFKLEKALELQNLLAERKFRAWHVRIKSQNNSYIQICGKTSVSLSRETCYILLTAIAPTWGQGTNKLLSGKIDIVVEAISIEEILKKLLDHANLLECGKKKQSWTQSHMTNIPSKFPTLESEKHVASAVD